MIYQTTSSEEIIGRIFRSTRITDITLADDIIEWIGEAYGRMLIKWRLPKAYLKLTVDEFKVKLPPNLKSLDAIYYNNNRLRYGMSDTSPEIRPWAGFQDQVDTYFATDTTSSYHTEANEPSTQDSQYYTDYVSANPQISSVLLSGNEPSYGLARGLDLKMLTNIQTYDYYVVENGYIKTTFEYGDIWIFYKCLPLDERGYPMIPDIEEFKNGLFWYILSMLNMIGVKLNDPKMDYEFCEYRAERFFRKAKNIIKTMSTDEKEAMLQMWINLIPPSNYYSTFFNNAEQPKYVSK